MKFLDNQNKNLLTNGINAQISQLNRIKLIENKLFANKAYVKNQLKFNHQKLIEDTFQLKQYTHNSFQLGVDSEQKISQKINNGNFKTTFNKVTTKKHSTIGKDNSIKQFVQNGICVGAFGSYSFMDFDASYKSKYVKAGGSVSLLQAKGNVDAGLELFKNGKFDPSLKFEASASASVANASVNAKIGNNTLNASAEASGSLLVAHGEARVALSKEGISAKVDVGAAVAKGEVKGAIEFFGIKISASGSGELGAAGFGAEFTNKKGEFSFGGKLSLIAGLGFKIKIEY